MKKVVDYFELRELFNEKFLETRKLIENGETHLDNLAEGFHEADGIIFSLPTIEVPRWIPVTERLPYKEWEERETGTDYYHCLILRPMDVFVNRQWIKKQVTEKGWFDGEGFVDLVGIDISSSVTHWMPLPEAPKDGGA